MKGIYKFTNLINNKCYIGKSIHLDIRYNSHKRNYDNPNLADYNTKFYRALRKQGFENFSYEILIESNAFTDDELNELEIQYIEYYDSVQNGQNIQKGGSNSAVPRKLDTEKIIKIKELLKTNILLKNIAEQFQVSESLISMINKGTAWNTIGNYNYPIREKNMNNTGGNNPMSKFTDEQVIEIRKYFVNHTLQEVIDKYGQNHSFSEMKKICYGCQFKHLPIYKKKQKQWILNDTCIDYPR